MANSNIPQGLLLTFFILLPCVEHSRAVEEKSVFVVVGDEVTLPCLFNRSLWREGARVEWDWKKRNRLNIMRIIREIIMHQDFPDEGFTRGRFDHNLNITGYGVKEGDFSLLISPVRFYDYGTFTCHHVNNSTDKRTKLAAVKLVTAKVTSRGNPVEEGRETTLRCSIRGADGDVEWLRGHLSVGKGKVMRVSQMGITDGGKWTCVVSTMNKTRLTINYFINVYKRGSRDGVKRSIYITPVNSNITLPGVNRNSTRWYKVNESKSLMKDRDEQTNGKFTITEDFSLRISDLRPEDTGHYECRSDPDIYYISIIIIVTARVAPKNEVSEGTAVNLTCDLSHPVPSVTFGWRHDTSDLDVTNQSSFTFTFVPEDAGKWMCVLFGESGRVITTISQTITEDQGIQDCMIFIWIFIAYVLLLAIVSSLLIWHLLKKKGKNQRKSRNK
uniref:limbic system-associated membrane protein-like isoform X1 n=2 Tax=Myxine glutinosa TaxID=7769 RepID=UPI00358F1BF9